MKRMRRLMEIQEYMNIKKGNELMGIANRHKKMAYKHLKLGETLKKALDLEKEIEQDIRDNECCPVCYKQVFMKVQGKCDHIVCIQCYRNLVAPKLCPLCRANFEDEQEEEDSFINGDQLSINEEDETLLHESSEEDSSEEENLIQSNTN